ncbi:hypothetical protein ACIA6C_33110, partial [Streptomyces sp. NPDC051578]|uniref:hypothetical protein n=1 Tax=Streptomyces sp. NPDC051578 TaxID=3365662 RepID=UPI00379B9B1E
SKEPHPPEWTGYQLLALIFGTLLSSQGTDASFVLTLAGFPPGASFVLRFVLAFPTLSDSFVPDSRSKRGLLSKITLSRFPFRRFRLYQNFSTGFPGFEASVMRRQCPLGIQFLGAREIFNDHVRTCPARATV